VTRAEVWLAQIGRKTRPVLVITRSEVIDVRQLVTVAEITPQMRGLAVEVALDHDEVGLDRPSVVNCDGLHTVPQSLLTKRVGILDDATMDRVCRSVRHAIGCD
jgi:mRNA-degrading endonuclease toxin of MazEF toxin-antitoxin module